MPDYNVTAPDGKQYKVTAPEGATQDQIIAYAQSQHAANVLPSNVYQSYSSGSMSPENRAQLESDVKQGLIQLPQGAQLNAPAPQPQDNTPAYLKVVLNAIPGGQLLAQSPQAVGAMEAGVLLVPNMVLGTVGQIAGSVQGITGSILNGTFGTYEGSNQAAGVAENTMQSAMIQPQTKFGQQYTQQIGEAMGPLAAAAPFTQELGIIGQSAKAALPEVAQYVGQIKNPKAIATNEAMAAPRPISPEAPPVQQIAAQAAPEVAAPVAQETTAPVYQYKAPAFESLPKDVIDQIKKNKPDVTPEEASRHIEAATLPIPMKMSEGQGLQDPVIISNEKNMRGVKEEYARLYNEQNDQLKGNLEVAKERAAPDVQHLNQADAGQFLIDSVKNIVKSDKEKVNQAYEDLAAANGGKLPIDGKAFADNAISTLKDEDRFDYLPQVIVKKLEDYSSGKKTMNFNLFENLRTDLAAEMRKADRAGDGTTKYALSKVRDSLESLPVTGEAEHLKPLADRARESAKSVFAKRDSDPAYAAVFDDEAKAGSYSPLADTFINKYIIKAPRAHLEQLASKLSSDMEAKQTIASSLIDHLNSSAGIDTRTGSGNFTQAGYNKALTNVAPKIDLMVDKPTADLLHQIGNVARHVQFQPAGSFVNNSGTATALMASGAKQIAEHATNMAFGGIPVGTATSKGAEYFGAKKSADKAMNPLGKGSAEKIAESKKPAEALKETVSEIAKEPEIKAALEEKKSNPKAYQIWLKSITDNEKTKAAIKAIKKPLSLTKNEKLILLATQSVANQEGSK